jgi:hypothetical protein
MRGKRDIKSYSLEDLKGTRARGQTQTRADAPPFTRSRRASGATHG